MSESFEFRFDSPPAMPGLRVAVLGAEKWAHSAAGLLKNNLVAAEQIFSTVQHAERAQPCRRSSGLTVTTDNLQQRDRPTHPASVKPTQYRADRRDQAALTPKKMCSRLPFGEDAEYRRWSGLRAGCDSRDAEYTGDAGCGASRSLCRTLCLGRTDGGCAEIFHTVGKTVVVDEKHMDR